MQAFHDFEVPRAAKALTRISDSITSSNVTGSKWRGSFERIRLLLKIGSRPRSRLQQTSMQLDRSSLALPIPWKVPPLGCSAPRSARISNKGIAWVTTAITNAGGAFVSLNIKGVQTTMSVFLDPTYLAK
jgi:hypothetical protein